MKKAVIRPEKVEYPFENGLFGVNAEITRRGFFGGLSAQLIINRKLFAGDAEPEYTVSLLLSDGKDAVATLMMWQRHGDIVDFVNFNNLANTHSQSVIETAKEGAYITAPGMMMHRRDAPRRQPHFDEQI